MASGSWQIVRWRANSWRTAIRSICLSSRRVALTNRHRRHRHHQQQQQQQQQQQAAAEEEEEEEEEEDDDDVLAAAAGPVAALAVAVRQRRRRRRKWTGTNTSAPTWIGCRRRAGPSHCPRPPVQQRDDVRGCRRGVAAEVRVGHVGSHVGGHRRTARRQRWHAAVGGDGDCRDVAAAGRPPAGAVPLKIRIDPNKLPHTLKRELKFVFLILCKLICVMLSAASAHEAGRHHRHRRRPRPARRLSMKDERAPYHCHSRARACPGRQPCRR